MIRQLWSCCHLREKEKEEQSQRDEIQIQDHRKARNPPHCCPTYLTCSDVWTPEEWWPCVTRREPRPARQTPANVSKRGQPCVPTWRKSEKFDRLSVAAILSWPPAPKGLNINILRSKLSVRVFVPYHKTANHSESNVHVRTTRHSIWQDSNERHVLWMMKEPVVISDGWTYEKMAIQLHLPIWLDIATSCANSQN